MTDTTDPMVVDPSTVGPSLLHQIPINFGDTCETTFEPSDRTPGHESEPAPETVLVVLWTRGVVFPCLISLPLLLVRSLSRRSVLVHFGLLLLVRPWIRCFGLRQLNGAQLAALLPPVATSLHVWRMLRQAVVHIPSRLEVLANQSSAIGR